MNFYAGIGNGDLVFEWKRVIERFKMQVMSNKIEDF
jgi:hypothetical protein